MKYKIVFHCGAELEVGDSPRLLSKKLGVRPEDLRGGLLRVVVRSSRSNKGRPKTPTGEPPDCHSCKGTRRKSGRVRYECFPPDYEMGKMPGGKYDGIPFRQFCERVIACYPKEVVKVPAPKRAKSGQ